MRIDANDWPLRGPCPWRPIDVKTGALIPNVFAIDDKAKTLDAYDTAPDGRIRTSFGEIKTRRIRARNVHFCRATKVALVLL